MAIGPLETLSQPLDGTTGSAANFGKPVVDALQGMLGAASGFVDANNGAPIVARSHKGGMLSYTNATNTALYPGATPISAYSSVSAIGYTVPTGMMAVVPLMYFGLTVFTGNPKVTVNNGLATINIANGAQGSGTFPSSATAEQGALPQFPMTFPLVLDQGWILTMPQSCAFTGYAVPRDSAITPIVQAVTNTTTYTVPAGKTLWIYGVTCVGTGSGVQKALLETSAGFPFCQAAVAADTNGGFVNLGAFGSAINGPSPIPIPAGTVLQSDQTYGVSFWGILL